MLPLCASLIAGTQLWVGQRGSGIGPGQFEATLQEHKRADGQYLTGVTQATSGWVEQTAAHIEEEQEHKYQVNQAKGLLTLCDAAQDREPQ